MKAVATLEKIEQFMWQDQGARFRQLQRNCLAACEDAFRGDEDPFRSHYGASLAGRECDRELWYKYHWTTAKKFDGRMIRLFNRGHLEEGRFIALLLMIGCEVWSHDADGNQFRISDFGGHLGGGLDCVIRGLPECPDTPVLGEFKTHGDKSFTALLIKGVKESKPEHYVQMTLYMGKNGLTRAIYFAVNKNTDEIHAEWVTFNQLDYDRYMERSGRIIFAKVAPKRISESPGWFKCKMCDEASTCHSGAEPSRNCRTCQWSYPAPEGGWFCMEITAEAEYGDHVELSKVDQLRGCDKWKKHESY